MLCSYKTIRIILVIAVVLSLFFAVGQIIWAFFNAYNLSPSNLSVPARRVMATSTAAIPKTDAEWKKVLTPEQYYILRQQGTERPFSFELRNSQSPIF